MSGRRPGRARRWLAGALAAAAALAGAGSPGPGRGPAPALGATGEPERRAAELVALGDRHFAARVDEAELRAAIAAWRQAAALAPARAEIFERLARAQLLLADGFLMFRRDQDRAVASEQLAVLAQGAADAEAGLRARSREFARLRRLDVPLDEASAVLGADAAPLLYFWAENTIRWAAAKGLRTAMTHHEQVFRVMERVKTLAPDTWYGGADRYFGVVYAAAPAVAGGDLKKSRAAFEESLKRAPGFLETWVLYAELYAQAAGDDALYVRALEHVRDAPVDAIPEIVPEQTIAKKKAQALLERRAAKSRGAARPKVK